MKCPKCGNDMINKGNVSGFVYTSNLVQRDETRICEKCKIKHEERVRGQSFEQQTFDDYKLV